jgi:iron(III) transport system substrate-binding protein
VEWERTVGAAKREGKVVITTFGAGDRKAVEVLSKYFPEVKVESMLLAGREFVARAPVEMKAGIYNYDVYLSGSTTASNQLKPMGFVLADTRAAIFRPDVLGDENWVGGFDDWWADDTTKRYIFSGKGTVTAGTGTFYVNREKAPKEKMRGLDDWLRPEFKGRVCLEDPRTIGGGDVFWIEMRIFKGEAYTRRMLLETNPRLTRDRRQLGADLVRGDCIIAIGAELGDFEQAGLTKHLEQLYADWGNVVPPEFRDKVKIICCGAGKNKKEIDGSMSAGSGGPAIVQNAPHPNAAKLFVNWFLSKEGQYEWMAISTTTPFNTCMGRRDLVDQCKPGPGSTWTPPKDGGAYISYQYESNWPLRDEGLKFTQSVLGR